MAQRRDGARHILGLVNRRLGFSAHIGQYLTDSRGKNTQLPLADLLRQSVYSRMAGYEDVNDAERHSQDPTFRLIGSERIWERGAALTSRLQSSETELLTQEKNLAGLAAINRGLIAKVETIDSAQLRQGNSVPEPGTMILLESGLLGAVAMVRRKLDL